MIVLRRILAVFLAIIFVITFIPLLVIYRVNSTVANPDFYVSQLRKADVYNFLYDDVLPTATSNLKLGGADVSWASPYVVTGVKKALPPEWLQVQIESAINAIVPYMNGSRDSFTIHIEIASRLDDIKTVVADILSRQESYDYLVSNVLIKTVTNSAPSGLEIMPGVSITADEVAQTLKQALPLEWYQGQVSSLVDQIFAYLKGTQTNLDVTVSLADRKPAITTALTSLLDRKLEQYYNSLPEATPAQAAAFLANPPTDLPDFRLPGVSYTQLKQLLGINVASTAETLLAPALNAAIPDQLSLGNVFAAGGENPMASVRSYIQNGFTFTEQDLRKAVSGDQGEGLETLDRVRANIKTIRQGLLFLWILPLLLLVGIGFLGGRTWGSKLVWAAAVLAVASLIALIVAGPVFNALVQPQIDALARTSAAPGSFQALFASKGATILQNGVTSFIGGIMLQAAVLLAVAVGLIVLGNILHRRKAASIS